MPPKHSLTKRVQERFGIKGTLRGYQLRAAQFGVEHPNFALLMAPRLGKTRVAISVAGYRRKRKQIDLWIVVCPSIAKEVWKDEIRATLDLPHEVTILEGKADERKLSMKSFKPIPGKLHIMIMNPEATWRIKKWLYKSNPCMVTVDESHRFKNHASKQSGALHTLGRRAKYRNILTGSFMSKPTDAFSQYKFLDPSIFGTIWHDRYDKHEGEGFLNRYVRSWGFGGHKPASFHRLEEMNEKIQSVAFMLDREQAGGFPVEQVQDFYFDLTNPALRHYLEMEEELKTMVRDQEVSASIILTQALRLQQIAGGFLPLRDPDDCSVVHNQSLGKDRLDALSELLEEYPKDCPLVIIAKFRYELDAILGLLKKQGRSSTSIRGGMKNSEREDSKKAFMNGRADVCVVQQRAGISIDLSRARTLIFHSYTQSGIDYEQAKARVIARSGGSVSLLHLVARGTVDEGILGSVRDGFDLVKSILKKLQD